MPRVVCLGEAMALLVPIPADAPPDAAPSHAPSASASASPTTPGLPREPAHERAPEATSVLPNEPVPASPPSSSAFPAPPPSTPASPALPQSPPAPPLPLSKLDGPVNKPQFSTEVGGAEANTACMLAALGVPAAWISRVGDDGLGRLVLATLRAHGVDVSAVEIDPDRPTGLYIKEIGSSATRLRYYRTGSAASAMGPELAQHPAVRDADVLHLSGITPALSESCAALIDTLLGQRRPGRLVSFDVNWRPTLWRGADPQLLLDFARRADLVFVGADEAEAAWGASTPDGIRDLLRGPAVVVVKQGTEGSTAFHGVSRVQVPALALDVVEPTGAGDAFAAGFLAAAPGFPDAASLRSRLRLGTLAAGAVLRVRGDLAPPPAADVIDAYLAMDDATWRRASTRPDEPAAGAT
jgi:2-dehydro-3-deoxygluconokinase